MMTTLAALYSALCRWDDRERHRLGGCASTRHYDRRGLAGQLLTL